MGSLGVAVIGAVMAGALCNDIAATGAAVLSIPDALVAAVTGAVVLLAAYHATLDAVSPESCKLISLATRLCASGRREKIQGSTARNSRVS